jgi:hypothetical protein
MIRRQLEQRPLRTTEAGGIGEGLGARAHRGATVASTSRSNLKIDSRTLSFSSV